MAKEVSLNWMSNVDESVLKEIRTTTYEFLQKYKTLSPVPISIVYCEFEKRNLVEAGNNFMSGLLLLKLRIREKVKEYDKSIVVKVPQFGPTYKEVRNFLFFEKEKYMYEEVLPRMTKLHGNLFSPVFYTASDSGILFVENLHETKFKMRENKIPLDKDHCEVVLQTLARFHATSVKYLEDNGNYDIDKFTYVVDVNDKSPFTLFVTSVCTAFLQNINYLVPERMAKKIESHIKDIVIVSEELRKPYSEGLNVICHGDFWLNNFLFQYDGKGVPKNLKLIDFQISFRCSPVYDLLYLFMTSVPFKVFRDNEESFIRLYLNEFNQKLKDLHCEVRFSKEEFDQHLKNYLRKQTFFMLLMVVPIIKSNQMNLLQNCDKLINYFKSLDFKSICNDWLNYVDEKTDFFT